MIAMANGKDTLDAKAEKSNLNASSAIRSPVAV